MHLNNVESDRIVPKCQLRIAVARTKFMKSSIAMNEY